MMNWSFTAAVALFVGFAGADVASAQTYGVGSSGEIFVFGHPSYSYLLRESSVTFYDIAAFNGLAYGVSSGGSFYRILLTNGQPVGLGYSGSGFNALDFRPGGGLFGMKSNSRYLYLIDARNGRATPLFDTGYSSEGDITFVTGKDVYMTSSNRLVYINLNTRRAGVVSNLGSGDWYGIDYSFKTGQVNLANDRYYYRYSFSQRRPMFIGSFWPPYRVNGISH